MFTELSDSSLGTWLTWLHVVGIAGVVCIAASLLGSYYISSQVALRAEKKSAEANYLAVAASEQASSAQVRAQELQQKLSDQLTSKAARRVTEQQKKTFVDALRDAPKGQVGVFIYDFQSSEVENYAHQIRDLLIAAGYDCGDKVEISSKPFSPEGLFVVARNPASAPAHAGAIQHAFELIGIDAPAAKDVNLDDNRVVVIVGRKVE